MYQHIKPSKFHFVSRHTSLRECMKLMQEKNLTYLLVEDDHDRLEGIFTLKDVIKIFEYLAYGNHLSKPVSVAMSRPVITLPSTKLHLAAQTMVEEGVNHLPVISADAGQEARVVGVVDMECILRSQVEGEQRDEDESRDISVFSPNGALLNFMQSVLDPYPKIGIDKMWASKIADRDKMQAYVHGYDMFFIDVVDKKALHFTEAFAQEVEKAGKKLVCLLSTEQFKNKDDLEFLNKIIKLTHVRIFEKPITMHDVIYECIN